MKKWFSLAGLLIISGALMFTMSSCAAGWNLGGKQVKKINTVTDSFSGIDIVSDTADISILPSEDGECKIVSLDSEKISYSTTVEDGILKIKLEDSRKWFEKCFNLTTKSTSLKVYLPVSEYSSLSITEDTGDITINGNTFGNININLTTGDVCIDGITCNSFTAKASTGDISVSNIAVSGSFYSKRDTGESKIDTAIIGGDFYSKTSTGKNNAKNVICSGNFELNVSTGKSELISISCVNFSSKGDTGKLSMTNVIAAGTLSVERSTGDITLNKCDAAEIYVEADTGDVTGTLLSEKVFITNTNTGKVNVPESVTGGKCVIKTSTGDIKISIEQ